MFSLVLPKMSDADVWSIVEMLGDYEENFLMQEKDGGGDSMQLYHYFHSLKKGVARRGKDNVVFFDVGDQDMIPTALQYASDDESSSPPLRRFWKAVETAIKKQR